MGQVMASDGERIEVDGEEVAISNCGSISDDASGEMIYPQDGKIKLFFTDPPYNIGFKYGGGVNDNLSEQEYEDLLIDTFTQCYLKGHENSHLFILHYPEPLAKIYNKLIEIGWQFRQWITWVYPSNTGHSENKWSTSHRTILWLTKGQPHFNSRGVSQNFKNPDVPVIQEKIKQNITGVALYDWWNIPQVKNVNSEHKGYKNQIPEELIRRVILCTTEPGDWVGDPFSGTFSTSRTALKYGRKGWGCDINPITVEYWPKKEDYESRERDGPMPNCDSSIIDPILRFITKQKFDKVAFKLLSEATKEDLFRLVGPSNGPRIFEFFHRQKDE
jgi:adenine-specific DNA-methyltransferase